MNLNGNKIARFVFYIAASSMIFFQPFTYPQITISQTELMKIFTPGNLIYYYHAGSGSVNIGKMNGPNIYDFSNMNFQDTLIITNYEVSQIPTLAERFPANTTTIGESPQNIVENPVFLQRNDSLYSTGEATIESEYRFAHYDPYELFAKFPIEFNPPASNFSQWISVIDTTYDLSWQVQSIDNHNNLVDVWIDGYGTLLLPGLSLECLRMKRAYSWFNNKSFLYLTREGLMLIVDDVTGNSPDSGYVNGYYYVLKSSAFVSADEHEGIPFEFNLAQNYPNPFNPSTTISYSLEKSGQITIKIFNILGREIETLFNDYQSAGIHSNLYIANSSLPSGVYFYQLRAIDFIQSKKMILLK
jgi:hypothetical protein